MSYRSSKTRKARAVACALAAAVLAVAGQAQAETTGSVGVVSDYLFRGVTQTNEDPALQGGVTWKHESGFYAGAWGSSISWLSDADPAVSSSVELDGFLGYAGTFGESDFGYDVGANYYWYPGDYPAGFTDPDTLELYFGLTWKILSAKYWYSTTDLFGIDGSDGSTNLDLALNYEFAPGWTVSPSVGRQWVENYSDLDYTFWKVGVTKAFENGFSVGAAYNDTNIDGLDSTVTVALTMGF